MLATVEPTQKKLCIQACLDCHRVCLETALHRHAQASPGTANHVQLLLDCAAICQASADFMIGHSDLQGRFCEAAAQISLRCAQECERFENDAQMKRCSSVCGQCAESCRHMTSKSPSSSLWAPERSTADTAVHNSPDTHLI